MKNRNVTGIVVAIIYCVVLYVFLTDAPPLVKLQIIRFGFIHCFHLELL